MARKQVTQVQCERCERVETREIVASDLDNNQVKAADIHIFFGGKDTKFDDLCDPCKRTVASHVEAITKKIEGLSPDRKETPPKSKKEAKPTQPPVPPPLPSAPEVPKEEKRQAAEARKQATLSGSPDRLVRGG